MTHIPRVVCEPCGVAMRCAKNGVRAQANTQDDQGNRNPYYKAQCDRWYCAKCGTTVLTGFGKGPEALQHETELFNKLEADVEFTL